jgi:2-oxoglutarate ferredoxin oxidoreductase subunit delta
MAKGRIVIDVEACKGCQLCITACPSHLIQLHESFNDKGYHPARLVDHDRRCTGCALCAMVCPDAAIIVFREVRVKSSDAQADEAAVPLPEAA